MKTWDILGLGCVSVDDLLYVPTYPAADTKLRVLKHDRQCGGITGTALVTAARLGARCAFAGLLGTDDLSRVVEENFLHEGVDVSFIPRAKNAPVPHSVIIVGMETGSRNIFYRIDGRAGADDLLPDESIIRRSRVLFIDQYGMSGNLRAASIAQAAGIPIVADFEEASDPRFPEMLKLVDHLVLPSDLAEEITGAKSAAAAAEALWHKERQAVVITRGSAGSWFLGKDEIVQHQPAFQVRAIDTTGCGDVFHGAYAAALAQGATLRECVRLATAAAGLKATHHGGQRGIPTRKQIEEFMRTNPVMIL
ncbi:MAG: permease [Verrucomicrobia bacterium]|nr:permease [Verrucomicrobiota bacterium]